MKTRSAIAVLLTVAVLAAVVLFLAPPLTPSQESKRAVAAVTWGLLSEVVYRLTDGSVEIYQVLPPGAELHDWEPTPEALKTVQRARVLIYLDDGLDGWGVGLAKSAGVKAVKAGENLPILIELGEHGHTHDGSHQHDHDIHVWLSPTNMVKIVENVASILIQEFPEIGLKVMRNRDDYVAEIRRLDGELKTMLEPYRGRLFITQHDAFRYLAEHYGLRVLPVLGAEEEEPSAEHLAEVFKTIRDEGVKVVYAEESFTHPVLNTLARDAGVKIEVLHTMEGLTLDDVRRGEGYVNVMRRNGEALVRGFG